MATMYPSGPDPDTPMSEKKVFTILEQSLPADWVVFHSRRLNIPTNRGLIEREIDFVILDPARGFIGLEVKGGQEIGRDQDGWYSIDHFGNFNRLSKDPGAQAQSAVHTLNGFLTRLPAFRSTRYRYGWGVAFPDFAARNFDDPSLSRQLVLGSEDLADAKTAFERLFDVNGIEKNPSLSSLKNAYIQSLYPMVRLAATLADRITEDEPQLVRLTEEQYDILDQLEEMPELVIKGGAGTGKTMLAMEKAKRMVENGKRVLFLCFNKPLADHLDKLACGFVVRTFHQFCSEMSRAAGFPFRVPNQKSDAQEFWANTAPDILENSSHALPDDKYDAIIVDEGQDFHEAWWIALLNFRAKDSVFYVFADPNQKIYEKAHDDVSAMLGCQAGKLKYNCRNTRNIANFCGDVIGVQQHVKAGAPDGVKVLTEQCDGPEAMVDGVRRHVHRLIAEQKIAPSRIVILTAGPGAAEKSPVWRARRLANCRLVELGTAPGPNEIVMATTRRFKGLESDVVIVCDVDSLDSDSERNAEYVAYTRARHVLVILHG